MNDKYVILVNTCDKFEDCWIPFFKLFSIYWPDYREKIYLNTEYKDFTYGGLNIIPIKGCEKHNIPKTKRATWSQCLKWALNEIDSDIVLYMQEDYFLKDPVKNDIVENYVEMMQNHEDIHCIHLTDQALLAASNPSKYENLYPALIKQRYRISCQAALWKKDILLSCLQNHENAWQFEEFGSLREAVKPHNFYVVDSNWIQLNKFEIIPYIFTGIVQGRWYENVMPLFEKNKIIIDYTKRGFLKDAPKRSISMKIKNKIRKIPVWIRYFLTLIKKK
jgi:hypothetical protein